MTRTKQDLERRVVATARAWLEARHRIGDRLPDVSSRDVRAEERARERFWSAVDALCAGSP